ncbi:MAG: glycoside hydrolase family 1 protein [Chloroflexaceae bacterium]|nr:glycoside hydrolase family 1 protein [Chloroflexaceae bacterium]
MRPEQQQRTFPDGFLWGTATSAHQVEGQNTNNQWWAWEQQGRVYQGDSSGDACGWWRDVAGDLDRAAALGQNAHRMSLEWSRIEPVEGQFDAVALARYRAILEHMHQRGITPMLTLHHFTNPLWLEAQGGWLHPATPQRFARYTEQVIAALGDCCQLWCTINEPSIYAGLSYAAGWWPPGRRQPRLALLVAGNMLRGHAAAATVIHRAGSQHQVGLVHNLHIYEPATLLPQDILTARLFDYTNNQAILNALTTGRLSPVFGLGQRTVPGLRDATDFFGLNYYTRSHVRFFSRSPTWILGHEFTPTDVEQSDMGADGKTYGEIYPAGLYQALERIYQQTGLPIYITETGLPDDDDDQRPRFLLRHLSAVHRALQRGIDVRGVFIWSLLDNFEWAHGWHLRFGLYAFDERTGERRLRPSGALYAIIARANALPALTRETGGF